MAELANWTDLLILHLIRDARTIERAVGRVEYKDVHQVCGNTRAVLWQISSEYFDKYKRVIPPASLESELAKELEGGGITTDDIDEVVEFVEWVYSASPDDLNYAEAMVYLSDLLKITRVNNEILDAVESGLPLNELHDRVSSGVSAATFATSDVINVFDDVENIVGKMGGKYMGSMDIDYFNELTGGGLRPGEVCILLGPSGGFKTTMAVDVCCSVAMTKEYAAYMTYEQSYSSGDFQLRALARFSRVPREDIARVSSVGDQTILNKIKAAAVHGEYLLTLDRTRAVDFVPDIGALMGELRDVGKCPRLIVIDQLGQWLNRWPTVKADTFAREATKAMDALKKEVAEKYNLSIILIHQLTAALAGGSADRIPQMSDSADCKSLPFWVDYAIAMGNLHKEHNVFWVNAGKTRRSENKVLLLEPVPAFCSLRKSKAFKSSGGRAGEIVPSGGINKIASGGASGSKRMNSIL